MSLQSHYNVIRKGVSVSVPIGKLTHNELVGISERLRREADAKLTHCAALGVHRATQERAT